MWSAHQSHSHWHLILWWWDMHTNLKQELQGFCLGSNLLCLYPCHNYMTPDILNIDLMGLSSDVQQVIQGFVVNLQVLDPYLYIFETRAQNDFESHTNLNTWEFTPWTFCHKMMGLWCDFQGSSYSHWATDLAFTIIKALDFCKQVAQHPWDDPPLFEVWTPPWHGVSLSCTRLPIAHDCSWL